MGMTGDFDAWWTCDADRLDAPNHRRGGWSAAFRLPPEAGSAFLKRQENCLIRGIRHPFGEPTFRREARNLRALSQVGIEVPAVVACETRVHEGRRQTVIVVAPLEGRTALDEVLGEWARSRPLPAERTRLIAAVALAIHTLHRKGWRHGSLYPKHLFVDPAGTLAPAFIDLERARWLPLYPWRGLRDLDSLNRRTAGISRTDRLRFLQAYAPHSARKLWRVLAARAERRRN